MPTNYDHLITNLRTIADSVDPADIINEFFLVNVHEQPNLPEVDHPLSFPEQCLCTKTGIRYHYEIKNIKTNKTCWVGSTCIERFFGHLKDDAHKKLVEFEGNVVCCICNKKLSDTIVENLRDREIKKQHMNHKSCWKRNGYKRSESVQLPETLICGKYKGKSFNYVLNADPDYCEWVVNLPEPSDKLQKFYEWLLCDI